MEALANEPAKLVREGIEHHKQGKLDRAARLYEQALAAEPSEADAMHLLGVIAHQRGDHAAAVQGIRRAIAISDRNATYHSNLGVAFRSLGQTGEALAAFRRALELNPTSSGMRLNLGNALKDASEFSGAADAFRHVLSQEPTHADAWTALGDALRGMEEFAEARRCHERAIELAPRSADAHYNLGVTHRDQGQLSQAAECFLKAACLRPDFSDAHANLANTYEDLARFSQALAAFDRALRLKPDAPVVQFNRALALLRQGDLERGWTAYEWRWRHNGKPRIFSEPEWNAAVDPTQTVLIYSEQGIGDEVMFASCFEEVIARSGRTLIECEPRLLKLFARSFPAATFFPRTGQIDPRAAGVPGWDSQIAAGSLPRRLRSRFDSFPRHRGYLVPDPNLVQEWRERLGRLGAGLTVGIAWRGGKDPATRRRRSTTLAQWAPLFRIPGIAFVSLQYGDCAAELEQVRCDLAANLHDWPDADPLGDLDYQAAQIAALDLVISVDNATVHLAGALNIPVWTLLPFASDWRWFTDASHSPWYPSMRLFRQSTADGAHEHKWDDMFPEVARALTELASTRAEENYSRGTKFLEAGRLAEAIDSLRRAAALRPDDSHTLNDLGVAWKQAGRSDLAEAAYRAALAAEPRSAAIWFNLGNAHREENRLEEAALCYQHALDIMPRDHKVLVNLAMTLKDLHRFPEALERLDRVLADTPDLAEARFDRSLIWLTEGNLAAGWDEYEWRHEAERQAVRLDSPAVSNSFAGRSVRILAEQGIGDQVMFASCLADVSRAATACVVECDSRLVPLFARSFPDVQVVAAPSTPPVPPTTDQEQVKDGWDGRERRVSDANNHDLVQFIGSLPRFVRRRIEDFPATDGYLKASPARVASWRARLSHAGSGLKVGIAWRGGKDRETQCKRSIPLEQWGPAFQTPGVRFFNLQHGPSAGEAALAGNRFGVALDDGTDCDPLTDLDDFGAKIAALDLVISADNSTVHLAGALGRPVWTLLPFSADWRWMLQSESTPWYPTMRLLRCRSAGDWPDLMRRVGRLLATTAFGS
ncbi:MAG TPA: tetratricopeptide repeat protein [Planctomycetaceae bacterium]|jgi:tetratricopeptide (TPR) repeat protein|nr:tetratricopeptide repeat protein [Planctomycetaceae bacterium]